MQAAPGAGGGALCGGHTQLDQGVEVGPSSEGQMARGRQVGLGPEALLVGWVSRTPGRGEQWSRLSWGAGNLVLGGGGPERRDTRLGGGKAGTRGGSQGVLPVGLGCCPWLWLSRAVGPSGHSPRVGAVGLAI